MQAAIALWRMKGVMAWVKLTLNSHPSGAAESVQNLSLPHVKNFACGFGCSPNPQVAAVLSRIKPVIAQVNLTLTSHPSGAAKNA